MKQARVWFDGIGAYKCDEKRHPQVVMKELGEKHSFSVIGAVPQSLGDGWDFWIEWPGWPLYLPSYIAIKGWEPVGTV